MTAPIRVLHSLSAIASGGVELRHRQIATDLADGFDHRFVGTTGGALTDILRGEGHTVDLLGPVRSVLAPSRYGRAMRRLDDWRPDLIHAAVMEGTTLGVVLAKRFRVPVIMEETSDPANRRPMGHRLARLVAANATVSVAVSPAVGRYLTERLGLAPSRVRVLVNGVPRPAVGTPQEKAHLRASLGVPSDDVVIGTVSRLFDDHKRVTDLISAFAALDRPRTHLVVVGDGRDRDLIVGVAQGTPVWDRIHFVGRQHPPDPYYGIMDVFAIASSREAFGLVAAEAMRAGLPVVATEVGGLAEIVVHEETGLLVPPLEPPLLADALRRLVDGPAIRARMGTAGRQRADQHYATERYVSDVAGLYHELLQVPPSPTVPTCGPGGES